MLCPGTRVVLVSDGEIVMRGYICVIFAYLDSYTLIGRDDEDDAMFGIYDVDCVEPYHAPVGPEDDHYTI